MSETADARLLGAVDGFSLDGGLSGWVRQEGGVHPAASLVIELRRGETVLAQAAPTGPRPDVTGDETTPAAFSLSYGPHATAGEIVHGVCRLWLRDPDGNTSPVELYEPVLRRARDELALAHLRTADPVALASAMQALAENVHLAPDAATALRAGALPAGGSPRAVGRPGPRIVFIGAGSTVFAKNLLGDILLEPALRASTICLYDINPERLRESEIVAGRIVQALDAAAIIETTTDLGRALDGADYAITMIQVGGYRPATVTDFRIPNEMGLRQTIADTLGIGGIMRALRTVPVLLDIAREMERRCPDVLHLNYANPMAMNCWAMSRASRIRTIGLCHSVQGTAAELAQDIGVPVEEIDYVVAGINHMAFYLRFERAGEDLYPLIRQVSAEGRMPPHNRVRYDVLDRFGYFVTESSEHFAEYVPWYIKRDRPDLIDRFNIPLDEYPRRCELQIADWTHQARHLLDPTTPLHLARSHEYGARIINAVETGVPVVVYGNVANDRLIDNLPAECCVEVPCLVDANGIQPVRIGRLPIQLASLMQTSVGVQGLAVEAALTGRRDHVIQAAMLDPHTAAELDPAQIEALVDRLLDAHRDLLPPGHYR